MIIFLMRENISCLTAFEMRYSKGGGSGSKQGWTLIREPNDCEKRLCCNLLAAGRPLCGLLADDYRPGLIAVVFGPHATSTNGDPRAENDPSVSPEREQTYFAQGSRLLSRWWSSGRLALASARKVYGAASRFILSKTY